MAKYPFQYNKSLDKEYYNPKNIKFVYLTKIFKELGIHKFIGWKLFVPSFKWCFDIEENNIDINAIPYIGSNLKIFRNHTTDMNHWKTSEEHATEMIKRFKSLNPYVKAKLLDINNKLNTISTNWQEMQDIKTRKCISEYEGDRVSFTGEVIALNITRYIDRKLDKIIPLVQVTVSNVITEYGEELDHVNCGYSKDIYLKYYKWLSIGAKVRCVGTVTKYISEDKYGFRNVYINPMK